MDPGPDDVNPEEGKILSPEELDIADDEHVTEIDDGRYVVSPDVRTDTGRQRARTPDPDPTLEREPDPTPEREPDPTPELTDASVHEWLEQRFAENNSRYGFDVTAKFDGSVSQQQLVSNDIVTVFESLLLWYARQVDSETPVEEVLGILLSESSVPVRYPPGSLKRLVRTTDLSPDDTIADLLVAVGDDDGVRL
ncbi:DUF7500 family protein [Halomicrobium urmianum]|uniref:DUF7500 family protein n=1 Tax=Halomicrobium urmianum TaxID=1586233 RepID=UPI001CD9B4F4|nr:hypothetical protein [Halomicrobium urmianum]